MARKQLTHASTVVPISADVEAANAKAEADALTEARAYCQANGLTTVEKQREFCRYHAKELAARRTPFRDKAYWQRKALETLKKPNVSVFAYESALDYLKRNPIREPGEDAEAAA